MENEYKFRQCPSDGDVMCKYEENRIDYESAYKRANEENRKLSDELAHQKLERYCVEETKDDLERENELLRAKLEIVELIFKGRG